MNTQLVIDKEVKAKLESYPSIVQDKINFLYELIIKTAQNIPEINKLHITLKWGQISFICNIGSTLRIDAHPKNSDEYAMYFHCQTRLVETFRLLFDSDLIDSDLHFEGNRAIIFNVTDNVPTKILEECIKAALRYHKVKKLNTLGIEYY